MTRRLIVIRHGKSAWEDAELEDHARPLAPRGRRAAAAIGRWLDAGGYRPDMVLCSTARRARETWEEIAPALSVEPRVIFQDRLYLAAPETLLSAVARAGGETVAVVGHNPGMADFLQRLVAVPVAHPRFADYPTCATTIVALDGKPAWGEGRAVDFVVPRELE